MDLRKREKYQYKFLKSVLAGEYDKLRGYFLKYVEYSNDPVLADGFSKINSMVQTGGAISNPDAYEILQVLRDELTKAFTPESNELLVKFVKSDSYKSVGEKDLTEEQFISMIIDELYNNKGIYQAIIGVGKLPDDKKDELKKKTKTKFDEMKTELARIEAEDTAHHKPLIEAKEITGEEINKILDTLFELLKANVSQDKVLLIYNQVVDPLKLPIQDVDNFVSSITDELVKNKQKFSLDDTVLKRIIEQLKTKFLPSYTPASPAVEPGTGPHTGSELSDEEVDEVPRSSTARAFAHKARPGWLEKSKPVSKPVPKPELEPESESVVSMGGNDIPYNSFPLMTLEYFKLNKQYLPNKLK